MRRHEHWCFRPRAADAPDAARRSVSNCTIAVLSSTAAQMTRAIFFLSVASATSVIRVNSQNACGPTWREFLWRANYQPMKLLYRHLGRSFGMWAQRLREGLIVP